MTALDYQLPFALDLMQELGVSANSSMLISPISLIFALSMAYAGAKGETRSEFDRVFQQGGDRSALNDDLHEFFHEADESRRPVVNLCSRGYVSKDIKLKANYQSEIESLFHARFKNVDFKQQEDTIQLINDDVSEATNGQISQIANEEMVNECTRLILLNSLHFKGDWEHKFGDPYDGEFFSREDRKRPMKMMNKMSSEFGYAETPDFRVVHLPFEWPHSIANTTADEDQRPDHWGTPNRPFHASFLVFLPRKRFGLAEAFASLDSKTMKRVLEETKQKTDVNVTIPQFEFENEKQLAAPLMRMGFTSGFSEFANFSGITNEPIRIDQVVQKTKIQVTKVGTEATAVTAIKFVYGCLEMRDIPPVPIQFEVDQPFVYMIVSQRGDLLFVGTFH